MSICHWVLVRNEPLGMMKPPTRNANSTTRTPPVLAIVMVLQIEAINLNSPPAICCIINVNSHCFKNLDMNHCLFMCINIFLKSI